MGNAHLQSCDDACVMNVELDTSYPLSICCFTTAKGMLFHKSGTHQLETIVMPGRGSSVQLADQQTNGSSSNSSNGGHGNIVLHGMTNPLYAAEASSRSSGGGGDRRRGAGTSSNSTQPPDLLAQPASEFTHLLKGDKCTTGCTVTGPRCCSVFGGGCARFLRKKVSKKKKRYRDNGFDLDLSYVTDRIIAMGEAHNATATLYYSYTTHSHTHTSQQPPRVLSTSIIFSRLPCDWFRAPVPQPAQ